MDGYKLQHRVEVVKFLRSRNIDYYFPPLLRDVRLYVLLCDCSSLQPFIASIVSCRAARLVPRVNQDYEWLSPFRSRCSPLLLGLLDSLILLDQLFGLPALLGRGGRQVHVLHFVRGYDLF